jgi:molybdopterin converting factor subunit 1
VPAGDRVSSSPNLALEVEVLYFAALRDLAGVATERVALPATPAATSRVADLLAGLEARHAGLRGRLQSVRVAVNEEFVELSAALRGGEVVALIPPVSGG